LLFVLARRANVAAASKSLSVGHQLTSTEVIGAFLAVNELTNAAHQPLAVLVTIVKLIGEFDIVTTLAALRDRVRNEAFCWLDGKAYIFLGSIRLVK